MKNPMKVILFIVFILPSLFFSQAETLKTIEFESDSHIESIFSTYNYSSIIIKRKNFPYHTLYLYDKNGNPVNDITLNKSSFVLARPIEELGYLVYIVRGWETGYGDVGSPDIIKAIDLQTGILIWESTANASLFEFSKDNKHILTKSVSMDRKSALEVINIADGSKITIPSEYSCAAFLDSNRLIFSRQNYQVTHTIQEESIKSPIIRIDDINEKIFLLKNNYHRGIISKDTLEYKIDLFEQEKTNIKAQVGTEDPYLENIHRAKSAQKIITKNPSNISLIIYNYNREMIEEMKNIENIDGKEISIRNHSSIGSINVDENNNVYLYASAREKNSNKYDHVLICLDRELNTKWNLPLDTYSTISKYYHDNKVDFFITEADKPNKIIIKADGTIEDLNYNDRVYLESIYQKERLPTEIYKIERIIFNDSEPKVLFKKSEVK
jgi:hypothetical protein